MLADMTLILRTAMVSDPGLVRDNNEDAAYAGERLVAVADGIGGLPAGEVASALVVRELAPLDRSPGDEPASAVLTRAIATANHRIRETADADPANDGMGTTVTAALLTGAELTVAHVGDSRGYLLRRTGLRQLTRDDTLVQALVDQGVLSPDEARRHPQRSLVTRALQGQDVAPTVMVLAVEAGDRLLLCSDGLSDVVDDHAIAQVLGSPADLRQRAEHLVKLAHQGGAPDNVTIVLADVLAG